MDFSSERTNEQTNKYITVCGRCRRARLQGKEDSSGAVVVVVKALVFHRVEFVEPCGVISRLEYTAGSYRDIIAGAASARLSACPTDRPTDRPSDRQSVSQRFIVGGLPRSIIAYPDQTIKANCGENRNLPMQLPAGHT